MNRHHRQAAYHSVKTKKANTNNRATVDKLVIVAAVIEPVITVPQALVIFVDQTAAGISMSTWIGYQVFTVIWMWWAWVHKEKIVLMYQGLFFIIQGFVIAGGIIYGASW